MATALDRIGRPTPLVGRSELLEEAALRLIDAGHAQGGFLAVEGAAGIGKSTFLAAVVERAQAQGFHTLLGHAQASDLPEPFALVRELIGSKNASGPVALGPSGDASALAPMFLVPVERSGAPGEESDARATDETAQLLNRLSDPGDRLRGERRGLYDRLTDYFRELAETRPLLLAVDDLHLADRASLDFLATLLYSAGRERVLLVGTLAPPGEVPVANSSAVDALMRSSGTSVLRMRPMSETELADFARLLLNGVEPTPEAVRRWHSQTEGNPLFVENLVRSQAGSVDPPGDSPDSDVRGLLVRRIRGLSESERRTLVYGAVLGREFGFTVLAKASREPEEGLGEDLDRLVLLGLLRERGDELYEFASERVRADVYGELSETRRGILHRKVLTALVAMEVDATVASPSIYDLARHAYLGRDHRRSAQYNRQAAEAASESLAFEAAAPYLERALENQRRLEPRDLSLELRLLVELGRVLDESGQFNRAEVVLEDAVARSSTTSVDELDRAIALLGLARVRSDRVALPSAMALASEAFEIFQKHHDPRGLMAAHRVLGATAYRLGRLDEAESHQRAELALAESHGTPRERGHALIDLANTFISRGPARIEEALTLYDQALAIFTEGHDETARARVLMNRGLLYHNSGRMRESLADLVEAAEVAERTRSKIWIGYTQLNLAQVRAELHDPGEARRCLERSLTLLEPQGDRLISQSARMIRGMIHEEEGNLGQAANEYRAAVDLARELDLGPDAIEGLYRAARLAERRGERDEAKVYLQEALDLGMLRLRQDLAGAAVVFADEIGLPVLTTHR
ncbi:MAG: tetratricopeptide repeat protein [Thermoplasmata archaeon]|nr:tetratricopeptide repeat protein [Thermoplasmata archaeon]